jgi:hypothetical protein
MGDVKPSTGRTRDAAGRRLLLLLHDELAGCGKQAN